MKKQSKIKTYLTLTIIVGVFALISIIIFSNKQDTATLISASSIPYTASNEKDYVYLTDLWNTDKMLEKKSSWNDARALKINQNEPGDLISLNVDGTRKYFINGLFAHAESTLIFDITDFTALGYDTFTAYLGVDTYASSNGNGVKFTILASKDNKTYTELYQTEALKGISDAKEVKIPIREYNYLKLFVDDINGNNTSDHAVYANAMIYNSQKHNPNTATQVDWIKSIEEYDKELKNYKPEQILEDQTLELKLLQRTLVNRVGYQVMQAYATSDDTDRVETLKWLFTNYNVLKAYISGGEPLGNYVNSFNVLSSLYHEYHDDLTSSKYSEKNKETFFKMMISISLTHSGTVAFWQSGANNTPVIADPVKRYQAFKDLYLHENLPKEYATAEMTFKTDNFESLTIEEMRWVVDARLSDAELPWLNWYSSNLKGTKYEGKNGMDPYTYIWYNGSFKWAYTDENYYKENSRYCAPDINTPGREGYVRNTVCNDIYHTAEWGIKSDTNTQPRLWVVWEEDGVCGAISKTGENLNNSYGIVAAVTRQPAHAAYLIQNKVKNEDGTYKTTWSIGNDVSGWARSSGTEKGERLPLNWGTTTNTYASNFNASYVILAQKALDDYDNYLKALEYTFIAEMYDEDIKEQRAIYRDIVGIANSDDKLKNVGAIQNFNLDGWYGLIQTYLNDKSLTSEDYYKLSYEIMANLEEYPLAMNDMLKLIHDKLDSGHRLVVENSFIKLLEYLKTNSTKYNQSQAVRQVAESLLGEQNETITFSFDGENANKIVLSTPQPFEYSLNYSYNPTTKEVKGDWTTVSEGTTADLTSKLAKINPENDIVVHILVDNNRTLDSSSVTVIDIENGTMPSNLYANDLENKVIGTTNSMEWAMSVNPIKWTKFTEQLPDLAGSKTILVREGAHGHYLPSEYTTLSFEKDSDDKTKVYVPISRLKVSVSTQNSKAEAGDNIIDGNINTFWHNSWSKNDMARWIQLEVVDDAIDLSKIEYVPRQDTGSNGRFLKAKLEISMDGENWTLVSDEIEWTNDKTIKTYILDKPVLAKYVRLTALTSVNDFASAAMVNLFENTTTRTKVDDLTVNYMTGGYTYDGTPKTPELIVRNGNEPLVLNEDYTLTYSDNINAGTGKITLKGMGAYVGEKIFTFDIAKAEHPLVMPADEITLDKSITRLVYAPYDTLPENWYWDSSETERKLNPGEPTQVKVKYFGEDADNYNTIEKIVLVTRENGSFPVITQKDGELRFDIDNKDNLLIDYNYFKNLLVVTDEEDDLYQLPISLELNEELTDWQDNSLDTIGTYHVGFTAVDSDNNKTDYVITFTLYSTSKPTIELNDEEFAFEFEKVAYTGLALQPKTTVMVKNSPNNHKLTHEIDYELTDFENNINAGMASVKVKGKGLYSNEVTLNFEIEKAKKPTVMPQETISVSYTTNSLSEIELPTGWTWADAGSNLTDGLNELKIIYAGDSNHEYYEMMINVVKETTERGEIITEVTDKDTDDKEAGDNNSNQASPNVTFENTTQSAPLNSEVNENANEMGTNNSTPNINANQNTIPNSTTENDDNVTSSEDEITDKKENEQNKPSSEKETEKENTTQEKTVEEKPKRNYLAIVVPAIIVVLGALSVVIFINSRKD